MTMKDRSRRGLTKRLLRAGVQQYVAEAIATANYPFDEPDVMAMFAPRVTGQPTWAPTAAFLKDPTKAGLASLFTFLYGTDPNTYMRSPLESPYGISPAEDEEDRAYAEAQRAARSGAAAAKRVLDERGEVVLATGGLRFGADRQPVGQLTPADGDFDTDLGWALVPLALSLLALSQVERRYRRTLCNDLARALLRVARGQTTLDESHWQQVEEMQDETVRFAIRTDPAVSTSYLVDFAGYHDDEDRPGEISQRVSYLLAYMHIVDPAVEQALVYAGAQLLDRADEDPKIFDQYDRSAAWTLFAVGWRLYQDRLQREDG